MKKSLFALGAGACVCASFPVWGQAEAPPSVLTSVGATALRRIDVETHTPVRVITREDLARLGDLGLGEVLQRLPFMGGAAPSLNNNAHGDGSVGVDIGGLGTPRAVVMLNGQRLPANEFSGAPAVDLDTIPLAAIDRIEIFLGGAAPTWGADAVAGVINVITRTDAQGVDAMVATARSSHGDGTTSKAALFGGKELSHGYANVTIEYRKSDPIDSAARGFSAQSEALGCRTGPDCVWPFGSTATPGGFFGIPAGNRLGLAPGQYTPAAAGGWRPFIATGPQNDLYSTQSDTLLRDGRAGGSVAASAGYDISPETRVTFDLLAARDRSRQRLAPLSTTTVFTGGTLVLDRNTETYVPSQVAADNLYNPFGVALTDVQRRLVELGPTQLVDDSSSVFVSGSLRHVIGAWELEGSFAWGRSRVEQRSSAVLNEYNFLDAIGPSGRDASGVARCGVPDPVTGIVSAPLAGCVPLDLFHGPGSISRAMLDYIAAPSAAVSELTQEDASLIARREMGLGGRLPARLALGFEYRRSDVYAADVQPYSSGRLANYDLITELALPFASARQGGMAASLTVGGRFSHTAQPIEGNADAVPLFAALTWRLSSQWMVRGRITQVYRAPSAVELSFMSEVGRTVITVANPCTAAAAQALVECAPAPGGADIRLAQLAYSTYGQRLHAEHGFSSAAGVVWNSSTHRERFLSLDLTTVHINDVIRPLGPVEVLQGCLRGFVTDACGNILASHGVGTFEVSSSLANGGLDESARLDLEARDAGSTRWGDWRADVLAGYLLQRRLTDIGGQSVDVRGTYDIVHNSTGIAYPVVQWQGHLQWRRGPWAADWTTQYIGSYAEEADIYGLLGGAGDSARRVGATTYHDVTLSWTVGQAYTLRAGVDNIFDRSPPRVNNAPEDNTDTSIYRLQGRMLWLGVGFSR